MSDSRETGSFDLSEIGSFCCFLGEFTVKLFALVIVCFEGNLG